MKEGIAQSENYIDVSLLPNGIYFITISRDNYKLSSVKLIVQH